MAKDCKLVMRATAADKERYERAAAEVEMSFTEWATMAFERLCAAGDANVPATAAKPVNGVPVVSNGKEYTGASYMFNGRKMYEYKENGKVLSTSTPPSPA